MLQNLTAHSFACTESEQCTEAGCSPRDIPPHTVDCCDVEPAPPRSARTRGSAARHWQRRGTLLGTIAVALLPKCPACWSVYAGLSSVLGLSFVVRERYLLPLTAGLLTLSLLALWSSLRQRRGLLQSLRAGLGPWLLACAGALATLAGKFALDRELLLYGGLATLLLASLWSSRRLAWLAARPLRAAQN